LRQDAPGGRTGEKRLILLAVAYVALIVFANLGSLRIIAIAGLAVDGGSLLYPFSFTARDILHKKAGASNTRFTILLAAAVNLLLFAFCWLVGVLPADVSAGPQTEYLTVLAPGVRLVLASVAAMVAAELIDTQVYARVRARWGGRKQWLRVLLSNAVSVPVDNVIFISLAFAGRYPLPVLGMLFVSNLILKYAVSLLALGGVYLVKDDRI